MNTKINRFSDAACSRKHQRQKIKGGEIYDDFAYKYCETGMSGDFLLNGAPGKFLAEDQCQDTGDDNQQEGRVIHHAV